VKRVPFVVLFVLGFALAGTFSAAVIAGTSTALPTATATTAPATTVTTPLAPTTTTVRVTPPAAHGVPRGVRIAGVRVGGLARPDAEKTVEAAFARPLEVSVDGHVYRLDPRDFATAYVEGAIRRARVAEASTNVHLVVRVRGAAVRAWAQKLAGRYARKPVDAKLAFRDDHPVVKGDVSGRRLDARDLAARVITALQRNTRLPVRVRTRMLPPKVTAASFGPLIVIDRGHNRLVLFHGEKKVRSFPVATGQAIYPTPAGTFHIVVKQRDPWWYPPTYDSWAAGLKPVPPGPDNPLGTRWMGLSVPGVGIHGTDEPASIGYSESHGCIRMQVPDAEWLFDHVQVGTTVHIV
jgi:lipoprotein-anchoring transpeptidase ErfK/SrfK